MAVYGVFNSLFYGVFSSNHLTDFFDFSLFLVN